MRNRGRMVVVGLLLGGAGLYFAHYQGEKAAQADLERLRILWPGVESMQEHDRALLAGLSLTCQLGKQSVEEAPVIACLRDAAINPHALLPKGVDNQDAQARLETLLRERSKDTGKQGEGSGK